MKKAEFEALSAPDKRRAIAADVLAQLAQPKCGIMPMMGMYVSAYDFHAENGKTTASQLKKARCKVCALGALFLGATGMAKSKIDLGLGYLPSYHRVNMSSTQTRTALAPYFSSDQMTMIEAAFEGWHRTAASSFFTKTQEAACDKAYGLSDADKMRWIMRNIKAHGRFRPEFAPRPVSTSTEDACESQEHRS